MAVTEQTPRNASTAAAGATIFPYDFKIIDKGDLLVKVDGVAKVVDVDFTVSGVGNDTGGDITFTTPMAGGEFVLRKRDMVLQRQADYQNLGDLRSSTLNNDQDAPVLMLQQLNATLARSLQLPEDVDASAQLPAPEALQAIGWNETKTGLRNISLPDAGTGVFAPGYAGSPASRLIADRLRDFVSARDFGAQGDGATNDTAAFAALEAAVSHTQVDLGGRTYLVDTIPTGNEYINGFFKRGPAKHYGRPAIDRSYRKRVVHNIDRWNEHQQWANDTYGYDYIAVQGFTVDEQAQELWLVHNGEGSNEWTWIEVRDWQTGEFKRYFSAGTKLTDSIVLYYDGATRYMLCKEGVGILGKYDVTVLPANRARIEAVSTHDIGFQSQIFLHEDVLYAAANSDTNPVGVKYHRTVYKKFDLDFNFLGYIEVARNTGGHSNDAYELANLPKRQGFAVGPGFFVTSHGYIAGSIPYSGPVAANNGVVVMDVNGKPIRQSLCEPNGMASVLTAAGFTVTRLENEGVWCSKNGTIYTLLTTLTNIGIGAGDGGTLIMEEFSDAPDALDFAPAAVVPLAQDIPAVDFPLRMSGQTFPVDRVTGTALDTIDKMLDYMVNNDTRELKFFTTSFPGVKDYAAVDLPTNTWVVLTSYDNFRFRVELIGFNYTKSYTVVGQSGARAVSTGNETDTGWQAPTLLSSWVNYAGTRSNAGYRRIGNRVHLRGVLKDGSTVNSDDVFTLPSGFRPSASIDLPIITGTAGNAAIAIRITSGGTVRFYGAVNNAFVSLDGVSFLVD